MDERTKTLTHHAAHMTKLQELVQRNPGRKMEMRNYAIKEGMPQRAWYRVLNDEQKPTGYQKVIINRMIQELELDYDKDKAKVIYYG